MLQDILTFCNATHDRGACSGTSTHLIMRKMSYISLAELLVFLALLGPRPALADRRGVLRYSTFLGTNFADGARALVTTADDGLWVASDTRFFSVQTQDGPIQYGSANITRWNSDGIRLFTSEVVGSYLEKATGVALGEGSSIWICGSTNSYNLEPASVAGGAQKMLGGKTDGFVARYSQTALLEYISFWGGSATDVATGLADVNGGVWVVGSTNSVDFPIRGAPLQATLGGQIDMSFAFFNRTGGLVISGVLGGSGDDAANAVAIYPPDKSVWLVGSACSSDFPQSGTPFQSYSGNCDAAIVHLSSAGHMLFSAVIGGADEDSAAALTVNPIDGSVWVAGYTSSLNFPRVPFTATPLQGPRDAFVLRFQSDGTLMLALVLGGSSHDAIFTIALNPLAGLWVAGATNSSDFPSASSARTPGTLNEPQPRYGGRGDGFLALLDDKGMLAYSSYLGGSDEDAITGIHLQKSGNVWAVGQTRSAGGAAETPFPTTWLTAAQRMHAGGKTDGFLAEVLNERTAIASVTLTPNRGIVRPGATVLVDVTVVDEEEGLTSTSASRINGRAPSFATGDVPGVYQFSYVIAAEDPWWAPGRLPLQLELMDLAGIKASVTAATDGNTLAGGGGGGGGTVGASAPSITGLVVDPPAGVMSEGAVILVTLFAANNETALMAGPTAMIAGVDVRTTFAEVVGRPGAYRYSLTVPAARLISYNFPTQPLPLLLTLRDYAGNEASVAFGFYTPPALSSSPLPPGATAPRPAIGMPPGISAPPPVMVPPVDGEGDSGGGGSPRWLVLVLVIVVGSLLVLLTIAGIALYVRLKRRRERLDFEEGTAWNPVNPTMAPLPAAGELGISKEDKGGRPKLGRRSSDGVLLRKVFDDEEAVGLTAGVTSPFGSSPMAEAPLARAMTNPMTTLDLDEVDLLDKYRSQAMSPLGGSQPATYLQPLPETLSKAEIHRLLPPGEGPSVELPSMDAALRLIEEAKSVPPVHTSRGPPGGASGFPPGAGLGSRGGGGGGPWPGARVGEGPPQDRPYEQGGGAGGVSYGSGNQDLWDSSGPSPSRGRRKGGVWVIGTGRRAPRLPPTESPRSNRPSQPAGSRRGWRVLFRGSRRQQPREVACGGGEQQGWRGPCRTGGCLVFIVIVIGSSRRRSSGGGVIRWRTACSIEGAGPARHGQGSCR
eukprot:jgi/Mesvir1/1023/Mv17555-RA.1